MRVVYLPGCRGPFTSLLLCSLRRSLSSSSSGRPGPSNRSDESHDYFEELRHQIAKNALVLRKHAHSHIKSREALQNISNLRYSMAKAEEKKVRMEMANSMLNAVSNIPATASIEIISNGGGAMPPCVILRTTMKSYVFNCPEMVGRIFSQFRFRSSNVCDVFITRSVWDNISGVSAMMMQKDQSSPITRIHGSLNIKHYLNTIRPFVDSDTGNSASFAQIEELPYTNESYEDAGIRITYIPLISRQLNTKPMVEGSSQPALQGISIAYYVELKEPPRSIDPLKLLSLKIPRGPWIGKLKAGEEITLADGRIIQPDDVYSDLQKAEKPRALFIDCNSAEHVEALLEHSVFHKMKEPGQLDHCIHMSRAPMLNSPSYKAIFDALPSTNHIVVNEEASFIPQVEGIYKMNRLMNYVCPTLFHELHPQKWAGIVAQNSELSVARAADNAVFGAPLQRLWMREGKDDPILIDLRPGVLEDEERISDKVKAMIEELEKDSSSLPSKNAYPTVSFLGTSSACATKYRNVSSYLVQSNADTAWLIDVGEGTYNQLFLLFGKQGVKELLCNLRAIFVTHAHQDHMHGLFTVLQQRKRVFEERGLPFQPLVLVANRNVIKPLRTYSLCFEDLEPLVEIVDISKYSIGPSRDDSSAAKRPRLPSPALMASREIIDEMPPAIFDKKAWSLSSIKAVQVHHTRMANGFVFETAGKKLVFSGDTKPCDLLAKEGLNADLLVHEATFGDAHTDDAMRKKHSTMKQAVEIGQKMKAKWIVLTHFSARYPKVPELPAYLDEMGNVGVAMDFMTVRFDRLSLLPKLIPIYRELFGDELFTLELKVAQKTLKSKEEEGRQKDLEAMRNGGNQASKASIKS